MKILVALDNEFIKQKIDENFKDDVYKYDLETKENVLEFLSAQSEQYIVITRDNLSGNLDGKLYIKHIKLAMENVKIVYIVENLTEEYKSFLFANEVFNIIEGESVNVYDVIEAINNDKIVIYKNEESKNTEIKEECFKNYNLEVNMFPKQIVAVFGTSGAGKSIVSSIISKEVAKNINSNIALVDMDIQNSSIDLINNVESVDNTLMQIIDDVDKSYGISDTIEKYMINDRNSKNLWYITNNCSIYDIQHKLSNTYYNKIYSSLYFKYDYLFIDLPASPFLDVVPYTLSVATKVLFVVNANYISIRQAIKYLNLITKVWDNDSSKIYIIVNKIQNNSLEKSQIESLLAGYKIIGEIMYDKNMEAYINGAMLNIDVDCNMNKIYEVLGIKTVIDKTSKLRSKFKFILKK